MNLLGSWIDAEAVSGIARELSGEEAPPAPQDLSPATRLVPENFDEPQEQSDAAAHARSGAPERERMRGFLQNVRERAENSGLIPRLPPSAGIPPAPSDAPASPGAVFEPPPGPLAMRIHALLDWVREEIQPASVRIIDAQGCPVAAREQEDPAAAWGAPCIIDTDTGGGRYSLVFHVPHPPAPAEAARLRDALRRTVDPHTSSVRPPVRERW